MEMDITMKEQLQLSENNYRHSCDPPKAESQESDAYKSQIPDNLPAGQAGPE
jgi:hypothetical protein